MKVLDTDRLFMDSPDAGTPECICSRCGKQIGMHEEDEVIPIRLFVNQGRKGEYRYHPGCFFSSPDPEVDAGVPPADAGRPAGDRAQTFKAGELYLRAMTRAMERIDGLPVCLIAVTPKGLVCIIESGFPPAAMPSREQWEDLRPGGGKPGFTMQVRAGEITNH